MTDDLTAFLRQDSFADILVKELFNLGKGDDVLLIIQVRVACAGNDHEEFVVLLARRYGQFLVGVAAEIEGVCFLSVENHDCIFNLSGHGSSAGN